MVRDIYPITCTYDADHDKSAINTQYIDLDPVFDSVLPPAPTHPLWKSLLFLHSLALSTTCF